MNYKITLHTRSGSDVIYSKEGESLLSVLSSVGIPINADCGGNGTCGKCRIFACGTFRSPYGEVPEKTELLACRAYPIGDCSVYIDVSLKKPSLKRVYKSSFDGENLGVAIDVGTTGICAELLDMKTGEKLSEISERNAQAPYGADIISRLSCDSKKLSQILIAQLNSMITALCPKKSKISKISISANTVMSHYIKNLPTDSLAAFPFSVSDSFGKSFTATELGINCKNATVYIAPCLGAFVGGDIASGIYTTNLQKCKVPSLFIDIGTNGEIALSKNGKIYVASAAAGPAFEGAELSCGMQASSGAVCSFDGKRFSTVGKKKPCGISGSGAIDIVAYLLSVGAIDAGGRLLPPEESPLPPSKLTVVNNEVRFNISDTVYLSASDVRKLQLAKAAIRAALHTLLEKSGTDENDIGAVFLAGAFGTNIKIENAVRIGLIPRSFLLKCAPCGNTSLKGATLALLSKRHEDGITKIKDICTHIELSDDPAFEDKFLSYIPM